MNQAKEKANALLEEMRALASPSDVAGQRRFGITPRGEQLGLRSAKLRELARRHRRDQALALELWETGVYEARQLAVLVADPKKMERAQMEKWALAFDNWATVDGACLHLFRKTPWAWEQALAWVEREEEYVRRAGFTLLATLAVHAKKEPDSTFVALLPVLREAAKDERPYVRKAVNWTLRQIGKRSSTLRPLAIAEAERIQKLGTKTARWIAADALRELRKDPGKKPRGRDGSC